MEGGLCRAAGGEACLRGVCVDGRPREIRGARTAASPREKNHCGGRPRQLRCVLIDATLIRGSLSRRLDRTAPALPPPPLPSFLLLGERGRELER
jgi:hypothetical protein